MVGNISFPIQGTRLAYIDNLSHIERQTYLIKDIILSYKIK